VGQQFSAWSLNATVLTVDEKASYPLVAVVEHSWAESADDSLKRLPLLKLYSAVEVASISGWLLVVAVVLGFVVLR